MKRALSKHKNLYLFQMIKCEMVYRKVPYALIHEVLLIL